MHSAILDNRSCEGLVRSIKPEPQLIARAILEHRPEGLSLTLLRALRLAPWAHTIVQPVNEATRELKLATATDLAVAMQHHRQKKQALQMLLSACAEADIRVLVFKGMALACTVYDEPATRFAGDIDLLIDEHQAERLLELAQNIFPDCLFSTPAALWGGNAVAQLMVPSLMVSFDIHGQIAKQRYTGLKVSELTAAAWADSIDCDTEVFGAPARVLSPADNLLFGLAISRGWSLDKWLPKPHDYLDQQNLIRASGLTEADTERRARVLKVERTWWAYATNCNAFAGRFNVQPGVGWSESPAKHFVPAELPPHWRAKAYFLRRSPNIARELLAVLPHLVRVVLLLNTPGPMQRVVVQRNLSPRVPLSVDRIMRGLLAARKLIRPYLPRHRAGPCAILAATLYRTLAAHGHRAQWTVGFRRDEAGKLTGHAWVEVNGQPVKGSGDDNARRQYVETFRSAA